MILHLELHLDKQEDILNQGDHLPISKEFEESRISANKLYRGFCKQYRDMSLEVKALCKEAQRLLENPGEFTEEKYKDFVENCEVYNNHTGNLEQQLLCDTSEVQCLIGLHKAAAAESHTEKSGKEAYDTHKTTTETSSSEEAALPAGTAMDAAAVEHFKTHLKNLYIS